MNVVTRSSRPPVTHTKARASELGACLDEYAARVKVLSLDCFDTLLWRETAVPTDVFYDLARREPFARLGFNAKLRAMCESTARQVKQVQTGRTEVTLAEIYREAFPTLTDAEVAALSQAEVDAEKATCHAFPPVVEMIRDARRRGLKVIIVSDTYFNEAQLRELLAACVPADVYESFSMVLCSSVHGASKTQGLHLKALERLRLPARAVLHVGDNVEADLHAATRAGEHAIHLVHHDAWVEEYHRLTATAASLLCPDVRSERSLPMPYRGVFAAHLCASPSPVDAIGWAGTGPLLYAFARFVLDEAAALRAQGRRVKTLFLMRDGYLPMRVCEAIAGGDVGHAAAVSRYAAYAASFRTAADIDRYLARSAGGAKFEALGRQLLLTPDETATLTAKAKRHATPVDEFVRLVRKSDVSQKVIARSTAFRARLYRYLERTCGLEPGDTLLLIDLGYEGTAQRQLEPVFAEERGVSVEGRYLLVSRTPGWERSRRGLLDPSWMDDRALTALVTYIALVEDLCTSDDGSVIDYTEEGEAVRGAHVIASEQYERVKPAQARCVQFARDCEAFFEASGQRPSPESLRIMAAAALGRLLFFPSEREVEYLDGFRLDMNLATQDSYALFDRELGLEGLRRRGMFFLEFGRNAQRMNYPIELRAAGLELSLTLLAQNRYGLEFSRPDMSLRREPVTVMLARGAETTMQTIEALSTHDGFYALTVPVGARAFHVGVMFGQRYRWIQLESAQLIKLRTLYSAEESEHTTDLAHAVHAEGIAERGPGVLECVNEGAFLFVTPPAGPANDREQYVVRVVFRPLATRVAGAS